VKHFKPIYPEITVDIVQNNFARKARLYESEFPVNVDGVEWSFEDYEALF
jgi:hypothetical protein